ncbi:FtsK/SpoIIIE domain-containing protein [Gorillibacterium sp. sgz5001074]|uniref:FtsK/SpoIIIE domain-containing protein n=1 Tax=Gorillibacterium sp. sgz5001074 TaxID=3446695 RepID=UPI003F66E40E
MNGYRERIGEVLGALLKAGDREKGLRFIYLAERSHPTVYESAWRIPAGYSILNVRRVVRQLSAICGGPVELTDKGGVVEVRVITEELPELIPFTSDLCPPGKLLLGFNRLREPVYHTWKNPHLLIAAETGWGKTEAIRAMVYQLCRNHRPEELEIHIIDMKGGVSFLPFGSVPHITRIAYDLYSAYSVLKDAYDTMRERAEEVRQFGSRRAFRWYRKRIIIIDEAAQLAPALIRDKDLRKVALQIDNYMAALACVGREIGFNLIYCTQYPHSDVINSQVKINCGGRLCFHVPQQVNSFVVLDQGGAEELTVKGRAIYKTDRVQTIQVPYLLPDSDQDDNDSAWEKLLEELIPHEIGHTAGDIHDVPHAAGAGEPASAPFVPGPRQPGQTLLGSIAGAPARKTYRKPAPWGHVSGMAADSPGEGGDGDTAEVDLAQFE